MRDRVLPLLTGGLALSLNLHAADEPPYGAAEALAILLEEMRVVK